MMVVSIVERTAAALDISPPKALFHASVDDERFAHDYRMTPDGQRFIVAASIDSDSVAQPMTVVVNWSAALR
jgi:hypothetical protein